MNEAKAADTRASRWSGTRGTALLLWVGAAACCAAAASPRYALPGLRQLSQPWIGWPLTIVAATLASLMSSARFVAGRDRLLVTSGFALCVALASYVYASPGAGVFFLGVHRMLRKDADALGRPAACVTASTPTS